jgi:peptidoglycan hydrolase CwlO-like protein
MNADSISPSWQDAAERWLKAYEETKAELEQVCFVLAGTQQTMVALANEREALRAELERVKGEKAAALAAEQSLRTTVNRLEVELERARDEHQKALASVRARAQAAEKRADEAEKVPPSSSWWLEWKGRAESAEALVETLAGALRDVLDARPCGVPDPDCACSVCRGNAVLSGRAGT